MSQPSSSVQAVAWRDFVLWIMILITFQKWRRHLAYRRWRAWNTMDNLTAVYAVSTGLQIKKVVLSSSPTCTGLQYGMYQKFGLVWPTCSCPVPWRHPLLSIDPMDETSWVDKETVLRFQDLVEKGYGITIMGRLVGDNGEIRDLLPWFVEARTSEARMDD